jgi:hypothetical protein
MALFFAKRNRLYTPGLTLETAVSIVDAAVRALPAYDPRKKHWSDQLIRWDRSHGRKHQRKPRPTIADSWLAKFALTSGDRISVVRANVLRVHLNAEWRRFYSPTAPDNRMMWRHRAGAEIALAMTWHKDRTVEVSVVRVIHRKRHRAAAGLCQELCHRNPKPGQSEPRSRNTSKRRWNRVSEQISYDNSDKSKGSRKDR